MYNNNNNYYYYNNNNNNNNNNNVRNGLWDVGQYCLIVFIYIFLYTNCVYANEEPRDLVFGWYISAASVGCGVVHSVSESSLVRQSES